MKNKKYVSWEEYNKKVDYLNLLKNKGVVFIYPIHKIEIIKDYINTKRNKIRGLWVKLTRGKNA